MEFGIEAPGRRQPAQAIGIDAANYSAVVSAIQPPESSWWGLGR